MPRILIAVIAACIGLAGSATLAGAGLFSATGEVIAILTDDLFVGEAEGHLSGAGTLAILVTNALVGVVTWVAFEALGMEQAGVWGVAAGVLHFVPYLGPALIALASGVAGFLQFGSMLDALAVAGVSLVVAGTIGFAFMTWLQSRFARVNAAVLFIALLFFGWLWGVWGLLLGAPLVAIAKVICDRVEPLKPAGELLGR